MSVRLLRSISHSTAQVRHFRTSPFFSPVAFRQYFTPQRSIHHLTKESKEQVGHRSHTRLVVGAMMSTDVGQAGGLEIGRVPVLSDNYSWILHDTASGNTAVVDPAEVEPIVRALESRGWVLSHILNTHHHWDHTGGNLALKERYGTVTIVGPKADAGRIPGIDVELGDGDVFDLGASRLLCFDTPGHTKGHVTYYFEDAKALFPGDTLFSMGCGRLFEGTPQQMWSSLSKLIGLPKDTMVYCAHEYTLSNAKFAIYVDPTNEILQERFKEVAASREKDIPTIPTSLEVELDTNPFLRPWSKEIRATLKIPDDAPDAEAFGVIRKAKDSFK
jgi:hydroxyacylglutathione hydrolase